MNRDVVTIYIYDGQPEWHCPECENFNPENHLVEHEKAFVRCGFCGREFDFEFKKY